MKFKVGDSVRLKVDKTYENGDEIPAGRRGVVQKVYSDSGQYLVRFLGFPTPHRVPEDDLEAL